MTFYMVKVEIRDAFKNHIQSLLINPLTLIFEKKVTNFFIYLFLIVYPPPPKLMVLNMFFKASLN